MCGAAPQSTTDSAGMTWTLFPLDFVRSAGLILTRLVLSFCAMAEVLPRAECAANQSGRVMIETASEPKVAPSSLVSADPAWSCRWCASHNGVRVLDAGAQPPSDLHPHPSDPEPDPEYPLVMVMCLDCRLVQLESDPTTP